MPWFGLLLGGDYQICVVLEFLVQFNLVKLVISFYFDIFLTIFKRIQAYWVFVYGVFPHFKKGWLYLIIVAFLRRCLHVQELFYPLVSAITMETKQNFAYSWFEKGFCAIFFELLSECH